MTILFHGTSIFKQAHVFLLKGYATFRCILQLIFNRKQRKTRFIKNFFSRALANGQTLFDKYRPEAASLLDVQL